MTRLLLDKFPAFESSWPPDLQSKWFEVFLELVIRIREHDEVPQV